MPADPIGDDNPIEWILLTGFPNPERNGCPPPETIQALGERKIGRDDPAWQHIWHFSPCFRDFKTIRDKRLAAQEEAEERKKRSRQIFISVGSVLAAACLVMILVFSGSRIKNLRGAAIVPIDLNNATTFRGAATLPQRLDELDITLPQYSPEGRYILAILKSKTESTAIVLGSGSSKISNGKNMLIVTLDLSAAKPGRYFLATRKEEQGQEDEAYYYPVLINGN